jgi:glutathione-specific gamma-glutamylcyclotransferase
MNTPLPDLHPPLVPHSLDLRERAWAQWQALGADTCGHGMWVFAYASLIWKPQFEPAEQRLARVSGWHRGLSMWSTLNRGTPERPGLVFALLRGGHCQGVAQRLPGLSLSQLRQVFDDLWAREMVTAIYEARWVRCQTASGVVQALTFTLPKQSERYCSELTPAQYHDIFSHAHGRFGSTLDYARQTEASLRALGIRDRRLQRLLRYAPAGA